MSADHDNHGSTPAAWTAVSIVMFAFLVGGVGVLIEQPWVFWAGVALVVVGIVVGKVMQMMGMGATPAA
ncbi:MAG: HGxxPAAW family protein [Actinomycetes bacterium]